MMSCGRRASARATAMRWRWPPLNVQEAVHMLRQQADQPQQLRYLVLCFFACHAVDNQWLADRLQQGHAGIQR